MKKSIYFLFLLFVFTKTEAQWNPISYPPYAFCLPISGTDNFYPLADGKIFYSGFCSVNSTNCSIEYRISYDDLLTYETVYFNMNSSCNTVDGIKLYNDSTFAIYTSSFGSANSSTYYVQNNFSTISPSLYSSPSNALVHKSRVEVTDNYIYSIYQRNFTNSDTLLIYKSVKTPGSYTVSEIYDQLFSECKIKFINDSSGFIMSRSKINPNKYTIFKTSNNGQSFQISLVELVNKMIDFYFIKDSIGYVLCENGLLYKTLNSGISWSVINSIGSASLNCIAFSSDSVGYVGGNNGILKKTVDGGQTWTLENSNTSNDILNLYCFGPVVYFKDSWDQIFKNPGLVTSTKQISDNLEIKIFPNPSSSELNVSLGSHGIKSMKIVNIYGHVLSHCINEKSKVNVSFLSEGYYYLSIEIENGGQKNIPFSVLK